MAKPVRHLFPPDMPRPPHVPWRKSGYYAKEHRPLRPLPVESLLIRKISALIAYTSAETPDVDASHLYGMCKELEEALRQHEAYVNQYLTDDEHEDNLFREYMHRINLQLRDVAGCEDMYVAELGSEICWMSKQKNGCMLNLSPLGTGGGMLMQKIIRVCHLVKRNLNSILISTQCKIHSMLLVLKIAIEEHEKYVRQFLSNYTDERPMYETRIKYLLRDPVVGVCANDANDSFTNARRIINKKEYEDMKAIGIHDPYNSILGLATPPTHNIHYMGAHHHGWRSP